MIFFQQFYLDREKDIVVKLYLDEEKLFYVIQTPNHKTGNLISNLAKLCELKTSMGENGQIVIRDEIPCYVDGDNRRMYILRLGNTKIANIIPDGRVELKASIPAISKTLMSQTNNYRLGVEKTIVKTYIRSDCKFRTDLHTHMNGNLSPDVLIALGIVHQIRYPYYYVKKLSVRCTEQQLQRLEEKRQETERTIGEIALTGKYRERRIDDYTFINFAELILGNPEDAAYNIEIIRNSLTIPKDGQAVFADLEKVYLYRYVFTKGLPSEEKFTGINTESIPDREVRSYAERMRRDRDDDRYRSNTLYQDLLLWIAREYQKYGIEYAEITDTSLLNKDEFPGKLRQIHEIMPSITRETGVLLRFLAGIRRVPLTIIRDRVTPNDYLAENLRCLRVIADDPYIAGSDIVGEEINDILELRSVIRELVSLAGNEEGFVIRIHAGENDSLRDNIANSIRCVSESLKPGQPFPPMRVGHGLYACDLRSQGGKKLLEEMRQFGVTLEFQITSNVRLNNLSHLERHPLKQYLDAGIHCVQGTDGCALYGTTPIDEELSLEKMLGLSHEELLSMRQAEDALLEESKHVFHKKEVCFRDHFSGGDLELFYHLRLQKPLPAATDLWQSTGKFDAEEVLHDQITQLPNNSIPVVVAGGSFNNDRHRTHLKPEDRKLIDDLIAKSDPERVFFVVGHSLTGQEGYLVRRAKDRFRIYAIVPTKISLSERSRIQSSNIGVLISIESSAMGLYKSFSYEIFRRTPSVLLAFDGNSAATNLIQEARNGKEKCCIFINPRSRGIAEKANTIQGYVKPLKDADTILDEIALL